MTPTLLLAVHSTRDPNGTSVARTLARQVAEDAGVPVAASLTVSSRATLETETATPPTTRAAPAEARLRHGHRVWRKRRCRNASSGVWGDLPCVFTPSP